MIDSSLLTNRGAPPRLHPGVHIWSMVKKNQHDELLNLRLQKMCDVMAESTHFIQSMITYEHECVPNLLVIELHCG